MTLAELHRDEALRRLEFPVANQQIYLAHAGVCPLPRRVIEAVAEVNQKFGRGDQETELGFEEFIKTRRLAAQILQAQPEEIALVGPTSLALSFVAGGLPLRKRDNILVYFEDYPSNVYPWMALAEKGVEVRMLNIRTLGKIRPLDIFGQIDEQTRLVALASCHFISGYRIDLEAIGRELQSRRILFCVDGIQTIGAFPTQAHWCDFIAADAHKWMLGPCAAGLFYVRKSVQEKLAPTVFGWHNVRCPNYVAQEQLVFPPDARRYEAGSANLYGLVGLRACLELMLEIGVDAIAADLTRKRQWLLPALQEKGYTVLNADASAAQAGGMISFHRGEEDLTALHHQLTEKKIITSLRADRTGKKYIRISPHYYNTDEELQVFLRCL